VSRAWRRRPATATRTCCSYWNAPPAKRL